MKIENLFGHKIVVINVGVKSFGDAVKEQGIKTAFVTWRPPVDKKLAELLRKVL